MKEDQNDAERTDVAHGKEKDGVEALSVRAPISKLVVCHLLWNVPAHKDTRKEGTGRQHEVGSQLVAEVH